MRSVSNSSQSQPQMHNRAFPNFFHAGFPKSATTWFHRCLREHPEVFVPDVDALHYFTVHFDQGEQWYTRHYSDYAGERVVGDTTPSYAAFDWSRRRLADFNPDAKILITLRNPIDRAFSHYFHMKQKRGYPKRFQEVLENKADLFQWLIAMGFYGHHLTDLFRYFAREQVCVMSYDLLVSDPRTFCRQVFDFLEIDSSFLPTCVNQKVNSATRFQGPFRQILRKFFSVAHPASEYDVGLTRETRTRLSEIFRPDIECLQELLNRDFSHWLDSDSC